MSEKIRPTEDCEFDFTSLKNSVLLFTINI